MSWALRLGVPDVGPAPRLQPAARLPAGGRRATTSTSTSGSSSTRRSGRWSRKAGSSPRPCRSAAPSRPGRPRGSSRGSASNRRRGSASWTPRAGPRRLEPPGPAARGGRRGALAPDPGARRSAVPGRRVALPQVRAGPGRRRRRPSPRWSTPRPVRRPRHPGGAGGARGPVRGAHARVARRAAVDDALQRAPGLGRRARGRRRAGLAIDDRLFRALDQTRLGVFKVFLASVGVAAVLSLLVSTTFVRPLRRLRDEARAILDRRGRLRGRFRGSRRRDEIGELARALEELTRRLEDHARFTESFAADLGHELKNPARLDPERHRDPGRGRHPARAPPLPRARAARGGPHGASRDRRRGSSPGSTRGSRRRSASAVDLGALLSAIVEGYRLRAGAGPRVELGAGAGAGPGTRGPGAPDRGLREPPRQRAVLLAAGRDGADRARPARPGGRWSTVTDEGPGSRRAARS